MTERHALFLAAVHAVYGRVGWQPRLAADLRVAERTVLRWANGSQQITPGIWVEIYSMLVRHAAACEKLALQAFDAAFTSMPDASASGD